MCVSVCVLAVASHHCAVVRSNGGAVWGALGALASPLLTFTVTRHSRQLENFGVLNDTLSTFGQPWLLHPLVVITPGGFVVARSACRCHSREGRPPGGCVGASVCVRA